jgi:Zn-dependent protease
MPEMSAEFLTNGILYYIVFIFSLTCHEAAHALAAKWGGDLTAYQYGQVTLNPVPHIQREPMGMVFFPWFNFFVSGGMMGWASAPYDPYWEIRNPKKAGWMALAGPVANFTLMLLGAGLLAIYQRTAAFGLSEDMAEPIGFLIYNLFSLNLFLGAFNLLPIPPLDGFSVLKLFVSESTALKLIEFRNSMGMMGMFNILIAWYIYRAVAPAVNRVGGMVLQLVGVEG